MELKKFQQTLRQAMVLPVVACLALAGILGWQVHQADLTVSLIEHSDRTIALATRLELLIVDEETGLRGYQTSADPRFLDPYNRAQTSLDEALREMRENAPGPTPNLDNFIATHDAWRNGFAQPIITIIRAGGKADDLDVNLTGKNEMDQMRSYLNTIIERSEELRAQRIARWHRQTSDLRLILATLALSAGVLIAWFTRKQMQAVSAAFQRSLGREQQRAEQLYQSEQNLRTTLVSIGDGVIACDTSGCVHLMNPVAEQLTGWKEADARNRPLAEVFHIVNETTRELVESPVAKVLRMGSVVGLANHTVLIRRDGSEIAIDDSGAPIRNAAGDLTGIVMIFRDVTLERRTRAALLANEKLAVAGRLAATIAHEIHNPLDSVANLLYLLRQNPSPDDTRHFLDLAQSELARVTQISRAMLSLYRESRAPVPIDLKETMEEVLLLLEGRFNTLHIHITTDLPPGVVVEGFPAELRQVFTNLIANATDAAGENGSITVRVTPHNAAAGPSGERSPDGALIEIIDSGPGIAIEDRDRLFQPFFTTKGEHGTGLGLWISQGIVRKLGGTLELVPGPDGRGAIARIFLAAKPTINPGGD